MHDHGQTQTDNSGPEQAASSDGRPVRWAGVDWSWSEHTVCVIDDTSAALERFTVGHTAAGLRRLVTTLHRHGGTGVAIERGDGPVVAALLQAALTVFLIVPQQVTALRSRYSVARNKDDRFDAYLLADVLRTDRRRLTPLKTDTDATIGLRMLVRARADLVKARVVAHNQLRAHLQLAHPGVVGLFHQLDGKISLAFLTRFPTPRHARWLSEKRLGAWLKAERYTRPNTRTPAQLFDHLTGAPAGHVDGPATDAGEVITLQLVALLTSLQERIKTVETHIEQALAAHADAAVFTSLTRSGKVRAASMLAEIGDSRGPLPHRRRPGRRSRDLALDQGVGARALRGVPQRLQLQAAPGHRELRRRQPRRASLGSGRLRPRPGTRSQPRPCRPDPGPGLAADHLALLDRPRRLRPRPARRRGRGETVQRPAPHRHRHARSRHTRGRGGLKAGRGPGASPGRPSQDPHRLTHPGVHPGQSE
ncbi:hypothetical protein GCM10009836_45530 [Pseudonocardia ailaonensis]|uniref:Transposase IS110-like N-terminal domain-containing protein n=1 Tax=Pseudonocardia ailaonensis TaxID=367279 RepID=A0ABN2NBV2_9PSEU